MLGYQMVSSKRWKKDEKIMDCAKLYTVSIIINGKIKSKRDLFVCPN